MLNKQSSWPFLKFHTSCDWDSASVPLQPEITSSGEWVRTAAQGTERLPGFNPLFLKTAHTSSLNVHYCKYVSGASART